jgi:hypothetical protein
VQLGGAPTKHFNKSGTGAVQGPPVVIRFFDFDFDFSISIRFDLFDFDRAAYLIWFNVNFI